MTLRPETGLEALAQRVATVLELRTGARVEIGDPPPPGLAEAVPAGHLAILRDDTGVRLVLGTLGGQSYEAHVRLETLDGNQEARSLALAAETLRDTASEDRRFRLTSTPPSRAPNQPEAAKATPDDASPPPDRYPGESAPRPTTSAPFIDAMPDGGPTREWAPHDFLDDVEPTLFAQLYGGFSSASTGPQAGVTAGAGMCAVGHCLVLASAFPMTRGAPEDVRYRYVTFSSTFYSRPLQFGIFTPGVGLGFLTRVGHFEADMGLGDEGLQTDLAARATLEAAFEVAKYVDVLAELGLDLALDRWRVSNGAESALRGDRLTPWLQAGVRMRP